MASLNQERGSRPMVQQDWDTIGRPGQADGTLPEECLGEQGYQARLRADNGRAAHVLQGQSGRAIVGYRFASGRILGRTSTGAKWALRYSRSRRRYYWMAQTRRGIVLDL